MIERKNILIAIVAFLFIFLVIPVTVFKKIMTQYFGFLNSWLDAPVVSLRHKIVSRIPKGHTASVGDMKLPEFKFVKFKININAKQVFIVGDFNKWSAINPLSDKGNNTWEIEIPLVKGKYKYLFLVDGKEILDPLNPDVDYYGEKKVSVITVD